MTESENGKATAKLSVLQRATANPWFVVSALTIGVIGVVLAVFFFFMSRSESDLVYAVNPIRTPVVTAGQASNLTVAYAGTALGDVDVTAAQIAIWNRGKASIRDDHILEDVVIRSEPPVQILEASVRNLSREVTQVSLHDTTESRLAGVVPITWRILERNDGASIQLIYVGSEEVGILLEGTIEGLGRISCMELGVDLTTPAQQIQRQQRARWVWLGGMVLGVGFVVFGIRGALMEPRSKWDIFTLMPLLYLVFVGICIWQFVSISAAGWPPFGF